MEPLSFTIDCRELVSRAAAHDCFARVFSLPAGYGRNLDALYDVLTSLPPCRITLAGTSCLYPCSAHTRKSCCRSSATRRGTTKISSSKKNQKFFEHFSLFVYIARKRAIFLVEIVNLQSTALSDKIRNMNEL